MLKNSFRFVRQILVLKLTSNYSNQLKILCSIKYHELEILK